MDEHIEFTVSSAGERLDKIITTHFGERLTRTQVQTLIHDGQVTVNGAAVKAGVKLKGGEQIAVNVPPPVEDASVEPEPIPLRIVYEDDDLAVIDKPAGLVVHPGAGNPSGTLVNGLLAAYPEIAGIGEMHRPGIVHRLDIGTSGLMVVARSVRAYHSLVYALAQRDVARVYRTIVWGHPANQTGVIDAPIGRDHRDPMRMAVVVDGKTARTRYQVLATYRTPAAASTLECRLESGRTHQIRVHLAAIGHPVVGDGTYGGIRHGIATPRPFLHAVELVFVHPASGETVSFTSPLPDDLAAVEAQLTA
jgi:23S rRNA pseudouridine1911/1915/1917 synthase